MNNSSTETPYSTKDFLKYFSGEMTEMEQIKLSRAAEEDPFLKDTMEGYQHLDLEELKKLSEENESSISKFKTTPDIVKGISVISKSGFFKIPRVVRYLVGTAAIVVLVIGSYYLFDYTPANKELVMNGVLNISVMRGVSNELEELFNEEKYDEYIAKALPLLNDDSQSTANLENLCFNIFSCKILLGKNEEAALFINSTPQRAKGECLIKYAQAIVLLQNGNRSIAKEILQKIIERCDYPKEMAARKLLKQIQ